MKLDLLVLNKNQGVEEKVWTFYFTPLQLNNYATENGYFMVNMGLYMKETKHSVMTLKLQAENV